jgi:ribosomal protein S18 acetylase RimI-like enzyme
MTDVRVPQLLVERVESFLDEDLAALCEAADAAILDGGGFGWVKSPGRAALERYFTGILMVPERELYVARMDGAIYGSAQLARPARHNEAQSHAAQLTSSFIAPYARSHGLARMLTRRVEEAARGHGHRVLNLDVRETQDAAIRLYESMGYVRWGEHPAYGRIAGKIVRGFFYYKLLVPAKGG